MDARQLPQERKQDQLADTLDGIHHLRRGGTPDQSGRLWHALKSAAHGGDDGYGRQRWDVRFKTPTSEWRWESELGVAGRAPSCAGTHSFATLPLLSSRKAAGIGNIEGSRLCL